jgi:outer membrane protein assembly factor BamD (BamD/ComL family)
MSLSPEEREAQLNAKADDLYEQAKRKLRGGVADEAKEYYEQAREAGGEEKLFYLRLLAATLEDY